MGEKKNMKLKESGSLNSDYTTKIQSSKLYGTGIKNRSIDPQNRIENPEINLSTHGQLRYIKEPKTIQWRKDSLFHKLCWKTTTTTTTNGQVRVKE